MALSQEDINLLLEEGWDIISKSPLKFQFQFSSYQQTLDTEESQREIIQHIRHAKLIRKVLKGI